MAVVKHSNKFKDSDLVKHNETLQRRVKMWNQFGNTTTQITTETVADFQAKPGFYVKDVYKGNHEWRGPFETEQSAKDWHAEMAWERKHS